MADISKEIQDFREAVYGEEVRGSMISLAEKVNTESTNAKEAAEGFRDSAKAAALTAGELLEATVEAAETASQKAVETSESAAAAKESETNAASSETNAGKSAEAAEVSEANAATSAEHTASSEEAAAESAELAIQKAAEANTSAAAAGASETNAAASASSAADSAEASETFRRQAESYAVGTGNVVRDDDATDNSKYYKEEAQRLLKEAQRLLAAVSAGGLTPAGTIAFEDLPEEPHTGYMYNISNAFITDDRFVEGEGIHYSAGTNIYWTVNGKWDVMSGVQVTGVKGNLESVYRHGDVNLTPGNIGALASDANAVSASIWNTARNINGMFIDGSEDCVNYGVCTTDAETAEKVVECPGFSLVTGAVIRVKFTETNTAENPTLCVNDMGAKAICYNNAVIPADILTAGSLYIFNYNGSCWDLVSDVEKTPVTGVKGDAESDYRTGNVNITKESIGLDNVENTADKNKSVDSSKKVLDSGNNEPLTISYSKEELEGADHLAAWSGSELRKIATSAVKKMLGAATQTVSGLLSAADKKKLDGIASGAQVNTITGVKGNAESSYRVGNVNLTPANLGALPASDVVNSLSDIRSNTVSGKAAGALGVKELAGSVDVTGKIELLKEVASTSYQTGTFTASRFKALLLTTSRNGTQKGPLASTIIPIELISLIKNNDTSAKAAFGADPSNYQASCYFSGATLYLKSNSVYDTARLYGIR